MISLFSFCVRRITNYKPRKPPRLLTCSKPFSPPSLPNLVTSSCIAFFTDWNHQHWALRLEEFRIAVMKAPTRKGDSPSVFVNAGVNQLFLCNYLEPSLESHEKWQAGSLTSFWQSSSKVPRMFFFFAQLSRYSASGTSIATANVWGGTNMPTSEKTSTQVKFSHLGFSQHFGKGCNGYWYCFLISSAVFSCQFFSAKNNSFSIQNDSWSSLGMFHKCSVIHTSTLWPSTNAWATNGLLK